MITDDGSPRVGSTAPPESAQHTYFRAGERYRAGDTEGALTLLSRTVELQPNHHAAYYDLFLLLMKAGKLTAALACIRRALHHAPHLAHYHADLAAVLANLLRLDEAIGAARRALEIDPERPGTWFALGFLLHRVGEDEAAIDCFTRAIERQPEDLQNQWYRALARLRSGDFAGGFADYDARWQLFPGLMMPPLFAPLSMPPWQGEDLTGRTLLVLSEQGYGDIIQFVRFLPMLAERGVRVIFRCHYTELLRLLRGQLAGVEMIEYRDPFPAADFHTPLMSLPRYLGTTPDTIPAPIPYLSAPVGPVVPRPSGTRLAIGIVWAGRPEQLKNIERSILLEQMLALAELPGVTLYGLQKGERAGDIAAFGASALIRDLAPVISDFADTASVMMQLDLIVSVCTSAVHLAGALGRPTFLLLSHDADWRWQRHRQDTPWYPTVRIFRQTRLRDWDTPMRQVSAAVEEILGTPAAH